MEFKVFGKSLFEVRSSNGGMVYNMAFDKVKKLEYLPDFLAQSNAGGWGSQPEISNYAIISTSDVPGLSSTNSNSAIAVPIAKEVEKVKKNSVEITPKGVYQLKTLNDDKFEIKADPEYVAEQIETFKEKLSMIKSKEFDMNRGTNEIGSILMRMENRKKYADFKEFFDEFPYTTTVRMQDLVKVHNHLKIGEVSQFLADMPKDAVDVMKRYTEKCKRLCEKSQYFTLSRTRKILKNLKSDVIPFY